MSPLAAVFRTLKPMGPDTHDPVYPGGSAPFGILHLSGDDHSKNKGGAPISLVKTPTFSDELIRAVMTHGHRNKFLSDFFHLEFHDEDAGEQSEITEPLFHLTLPDRPSQLPRALPCAPHPRPIPSTHTHNQISSFLTDRSEVWQMFP